MGSTASLADGDNDDIDSPLEPDWANPELAAAEEEFAGLLCLRVR